MAGHTQTPEEFELRLEELRMLQEHYARFEDFLEDGMALLGFHTSPVQFDIGRFMAYGPKLSMVQAQRSQAKTTIAACFAVWTLIQNPKARVLIVSAGGTQASDISILIVRMIQNMEGLECLRPDKSAGDRTSTEQFDVHYSLKGIDKSPSVACIGVGGNLQGKRADLLLADDVESSKNSLTMLMREQLENITRDFVSICTNGRILYLGTPQTMDSIYNRLPGRGYTVRIWPGRYPTPQQMNNYGDMLAPMLMRAIQENPALQTGGGITGEQGQPIDPGDHLGEEKLQYTEADQGPAYFQLQHMLNTTLADGLRYPIKTQDLIVMRCGKDGLYPTSVTRGFSDAYLKDFNSGSVNFKMSQPYINPEEPPAMAKLQAIVMYVDPAGGGKNGDETGYAVVGFLNSTLFLLAAGGIAGGYSVEGMKYLAEIAKEWNVSLIRVEKNMGYGAFSAVWLPILRNVHPTAGIEDDLVHGQKELRIIETLEPIIARGSLVINEDVIEEDNAACQKHELAKRPLYSLFFQMKKITRDRGALAHDDRLDALEGACRYFVAEMAMDQQKAVDAQRRQEHAELMRDPLGKGRYDYMAPKTNNSVFNRYRI